MGTRPIGLSTNNMVYDSELNHKVSSLSRLLYWTIFIILWTIGWYDLAMLHILHSITLAIVPEEHSSESTVLNSEHTIPDHIWFENAPPPMVAKESAFRLTKKLYIEMDPYKIINLVRTSSINKGLMVRIQKDIDELLSKSHSHKMDYLRQSKKSSIILDSIVESASIRGKYMNLFSENDNLLTFDDELLYRNRVRLANYTSYIKPRVAFMRTNTKKEARPLKNRITFKTFSYLETLSQYATESLLSYGLYPYRDHDYDAYFKQENDDLVEEPITIGIDEAIIYKIALHEFGGWEPNYFDRPYERHLFAEKIQEVRKWYYENIESVRKKNYEWMKNLFNSRVSPELGNSLETYSESNLEFLVTLRKHIYTDKEDFSRKKYIPLQTIRFFMDDPKLRKYRMVREDSYIMRKKRVKEKLLESLNSEFMDDVHSVTTLNRLEMFKKLRKES